MIPKTTEELFGGSGVSPLTTEELFNSTPNTDVTTEEVQTTPLTMKDIITGGEYGKPLDWKQIRGKVWEGLKMPEQYLKKGTSKLEDLTSNAISSPGGLTGDITSDAFLGTAAATANQVLPEFASRGNIVTMGALEGLGAATPVVKSLGKYGGKIAESLSGLGYKTQAPGALQKTVNDPSLLFAKGLDSARQSYLKAKGGVEAIREELLQPMDKLSYVNKALEFVKDGSLTADEALEARKAAKSLLGKITDAAFKNIYKIFDNVAKTKFAEADIDFARASVAEKLREFLPVNKSGTPSLVKGALMKMYPWLAPVISPVVQGAAAATIGTLGKAITPLIKNPASAAALNTGISLLDRLKNRKKQ